MSVQHIGYSETADARCEAIGKTVDTKQSVNSRTRMMCCVLGFFGRLTWKGLMEDRQHIFLQNAVFVL